MKKFLQYKYYSFIIIILLFFTEVSGQGLHNPISSPSISLLIASVVQIILFVLTPIAILYLIYAGFLFVAARGNPTKLADARKNLIWTLVGIVILLGATVLATVIKNTLTALGAEVLP